MCWVLLQSTKSVKNTSNNDAIIETVHKHNAVCAQQQLLPVFERNSKMLTCAMLQLLQCWTEKTAHVYSQAANFISNTWQFNHPFSYNLLVHLHRS